MDKMKIYQNYLFDADGTLIDTVELIYQSFLHVFQKYSEDSIDKRRIIGDMGRPLLEMMQSYFPGKTREEVEWIANQYRGYQLTIYREYLAPFPRVQETLSALKKQGRKLAVVTSRMEDTAFKFLSHIGILDFFDAVVTPESTHNHKPHPEPALKALELLNGDVATSVFIGDASYDIRCGKEAGMDTIFVNWSQDDPSAYDAKPTYKINDMNDLLAPWLS